MFVPKDDQDGWLYAVIVDGPVGRVVPQVGREPGRHRGRSNRPAFPLQEEGPCVGAPAQNAKGVGMDGSNSVPISEVPRSPVRWIELLDLPSLETGPA